MNNRLSRFLICATAPLLLAAGVWAADDGQASVTGPIAETMDSGGYTYVRVDTESGPVWAASEKTELAVGDTVTIPPGMIMRDFHSPTLDRSFEAIRFVNSFGPTDDANTGLPPGHPSIGTQDAYDGNLPPGHPSVGGYGEDDSYMPPGHPSVSDDTAHPNPRTKASDAPELTEDILAPAGGVRIAEIYARRSELAGQQVTVRGQVTKVNNNIMGRNWFHLRDGSGAAGQDDDLTVTSDANVRRGDIVTVEGTLAVDQDFGYGYAYPVLLEKAAVAP